MLKIGDELFTANYIIRIGKVEARIPNFFPTFMEMTQALKEGYSIERPRPVHIYTFFEVELINGKTLRRVFKVRDCFTEEDIQEYDQEMARLRRWKEEESPSDTMIVVEFKDSVKKVVTDKLMAYAEKRRRFLEQKVNEAKAPMEI